MLNWVAILRRILNLYGVKTQQELSMALGVPVSVGLEKEHVDQIPWQILEIIVADKKVSWDWLLTGRNNTAVQKNGTVDKKADAPDQPPPPPPAAVPAVPAVSRPPRIETRELERRLLGAAPSCPADEAMERLETLRADMEQEIDRIEKRLTDRGDL